MELFSKRYEDTLNWDTEKFDEIVTKGCFPLHPLTTALLCDLKLHGVVAQGSNPCTVLGFIFKLVNDKKDQQAIIDAQLIGYYLYLWLSTLEITFRKLPLDYMTMLNGT